MRNRCDERHSRPDTSPVLWSAAEYDCATAWCNQSVCPPAYQTLFRYSQLRELMSLSGCGGAVRKLGVCGQDLAHGMCPEAAVERSVQHLKWSMPGQRMAS